MSTDLATWIDQQPPFLGNQWISTLEPRKQEEAGFHDTDRLDGRDMQEESTSNRRFYDAAHITLERVNGWIRANVPGRVFLDYACGNGTQTLSAAQSGARLAVGIDISEVSVAGARERAKQQGLDGRVRFLQRDCESTTFPGDSFDACLCSGMLHHLDLTKAFPELHRIMRVGGRIFCVEALSYNPAIRLYRRMTPELRTAWEREHILGMREVRFARQWFDVENIKFLLLTAPLATLLPAGPVRRLGVRLGLALDSLLTRIPGLRLWSWQFTFELVKRQ